MKILVIGSGGREHVLCWKLKQSPRAEKIYCAPGNAGIADSAECVPIEVGELEKLADFAEKNGIDFTVVGPEAPLCAGVVDLFQSRKLKIFGPDRYAAQLEGSKDFAKQFMLRHHIPTARAASFENLKDAASYIEKEFASGEKGIVIKADGLAAGKGVLVAENAAEAIEFARECFDGAFGQSGARVLVEECLFGEEASILALTDGKTIVPLASSQDHKRAYDLDKGPNTGGMGAYSPAPVVTDEVMAIINRDILANFLKGIQAEKMNFRGLIFVGVMVTDKGPRVLEFNVRFGDPEVQPVMRRFEGDLLDVMEKTVDGCLDQAKFGWAKGAAVSVVIASGGYPGDYCKGYEITGLDAAASEGAVVFHAGTAWKNGRVVNSGGRVLGVSALAPDIPGAIERAYRAAGKIAFQDHFYRTDIGAKALKK